MLANADLESLRTRFEAERPTYTAVACHVSDCLRESARDHGLAASFSARAKEIDSFVKKALLKGYSDPYEQIRDKAGVRMLLSYRDDLGSARSIVEASPFTKVNETDKTETIEEDSEHPGTAKLGYRGLHFEVAMPADLVVAIDQEERAIGGLVCEIQIQTRAENLWNDVSHHFLYKTPQDAPRDIRRRIIRLVALMEIFDEELVRTRKAMAEQPGSVESAMLGKLEQLFLSRTGSSYNKELSFEVLESLKTLLEEDEVQHFDQLMDRFLELNDDQLVHVYRQYRVTPTANPLLFQPEAILIFERLKRDRYAIAEEWAKHYPESLLRQLATVFGVGLP